MIHHACVQGSEQWLRLRMGKPTASEFDRIITPAKLETKDGEIKGWKPTKSETRRNYLVKLLTELILDCPLDQVTTAAIQHGKDWEAKTRAAYSFECGVDVEDAGFCTDDAELIGASPDGLVGEEGTAEFKSPERPEIHCGYMLDPSSLVDEYFVQVQGELHVCERRWCDLTSYFGGMPRVTVRCFPEPEFQRRLKDALCLFTNDMEHYIQLAKDKGWIKPPAPANAPSDKHAVTMADLDFILAARKAQGEALENEQR